MSDQTEAYIIDSWSKGMTTTEIARALHTTRNVIAGKISRMRDKGVLLATRVSTAPKRKPRKRPQSFIMRPKETQSKPAYIPRLTGIPDIETLFKQNERRKERVTLMQLTASSCRYIVEGTGAGAIYCGRKRADYSYCEEHHRLCYQPLAQYKRAVSPRH